MTLSERRAVFVYEAARLAAIAADAPVIPAPWEDRETDFKVQFLDVIDKQCGPSRSSSADYLHFTWMQEYLKMGWSLGPFNPEKKTHPDLVRFEELEQREQDKDYVFVALCEIARQWIYEAES